MAKGRAEIRQDFIVNDTNRLPYEVAGFIGQEKSNKMMNPCWFVARTGCGKSHLVSMIAEEALLRGGKVEILTGETFLRTFLLVIKEQGMQTKAIEQTIVRNWFGVDMLIIEELDSCVEGKSATQSFLIDVIFCLVRKFGVRVIITSRRIEKSFFECMKKRCHDAVAVPIFTPDFSLRKKIAVSKLEALGLAYENEAVDCVAAHTGNGAQIRGIVEQLKLYRDLNKMEAVTKEVMMDILKIKGYLV